MLLLWNQQEMTPQILQLENKFYSVTLWPVWGLSDNTSQMQAIVQQITVHYKRCTKTVHFRTTTLWELPCGMWNNGNTEERHKKWIPKPLSTDISGEKGATTSQQQQYVYETIWGLVWDVRIFHLVTNKKKPHPLFFLHVIYQHTPRGM